MSTLADLNTAIGGRLMAARADRAAEIPIGRIETDSRQVRPGDLFWALPGKNVHGSRFADDAFERGAQGAVVTGISAVPDARWAVCVDDTYRALVDWATVRRCQFRGTLIAVTGSVGKTTTRQMIHTILASRLRGSASPRNFNNHLGVPLSMTAIEPDHDYAVLELGASRRGEIAALAELCAPKIGVITQIGEAHLAGFGSQQAIAESKAELLDALPGEGRAVLGDDPWLRPLASRSAAPVTWVGLGEHCDVQAHNIECGGGLLNFQVETVPFRVPVWGGHHLTGALAAIAVAHMMGLDLPEIADALAAFRPMPMRCEVMEIRGATIINDAYNSSPTAMRAALTLLRDFDVRGRRIVVSGDMNELGQQSATLHWRLGKEIVNLGATQLLIACGQYARHVTAGARAAGLVRTRTIPCDTLDDALPYLGQSILPGDVVLVKGSRMMGMERVVEALKHYPQRRTA